MMLGFSASSGIAARMIYFNARNLVVGAFGVDPTFPGGPRLITSLAVGRGRRGFYASACRTIPHVRWSRAASSRFWLAIYKRQQSFLFALDGRGYWRSK